MKIFANKEKKYTVIVGCGRLGASLANELSNDSEDVLIMDGNAESLKKLSESYGGLSLVGDGANLDKLREAKIHTATTLIAVTDDDNTNIMIAQMARELFGVKRVIARLYDPECEEIYRSLGINTICPAVLSAKEIDKLMDGFSAKEGIA